MTPRIMLTLAAILAASACDSGTPVSNNSDAGSPATNPVATTPQKPAAPAQAEPQPEPGKFAGLSECLSYCERDDVIPTNRATCRLNCDGSYGAAADKDPTAPPVDEPIATVGNCFARCYGGPGDQAACVTDCKTAASTVRSPLATTMIDSLDTCIRTCHTDKSKIPTNVRTCELNCQQNARSTPPQMP